MDCNEDFLVLGPSVIQLEETSPTEEINLDLSLRQKIVIRPSKKPKNNVASTISSSLESVFHNPREKSRLVAESEPIQFKKRKARPKLIMHHESISTSKEGSSEKSRTNKLERVREAREVAEKREQQVVSVENRQVDKKDGNDAEDGLVLDPLSAKQWNHCKCTIEGRERCKPCKLAKAFDRFYRRVDLLQQLIDESRDPNWQNPRS